MKRNRLIFYGVFGALHLFIFLFSLYMDSQRNNIEFLLALQGKIGLLKYASFLLLILFATNVVLHYRDNRRNVREKEKMTHELNVLKAKVYDLQQGAKPGTQQPAQ